MALYRAVSGFSRVLVIPETTKFCTFSWSPTNIVFSHMTKVMVFEDDDIFCLLCSSIHEVWARFYSSTLETRLKYAPTDAFETFPFPVDSVGLTTIGVRYDECRRQIMVTRREGITQTYNRYHNREDSSAEIAELRRLHVQMDNAVAAAYRWQDIELGHGFHETKQGIRFTLSESARREVLDRLLALNHQRHAEEVAVAAIQTSAMATVRGRKKGASNGQTVMDF